MEGKITKVFNAADQIQAEIGAALGRGGPYADAPLRRRHGALLDPPARRGRHVCGKYPYHG